MVIMRRVNKYTWKLDETRSVTYDGNGTGSITITPGGARERWEIHFVSVSSTTAVNSNKVPEMREHRGSVNGPQIGGTYSATADSNTDPILLQMNEGIAFVFRNGDPGAVGTVHIEGLRLVWGN